MKSKCCGFKANRDYLGNLRCSNCLLITTPKRNARIVYIFIFGLVLMGFTVIGNEEHISNYKYSIIKDSCSDIELTDSTVLHELEKDSCMFPEFALRQIHLESNWYKSELCKENHNLVGLKCSCKYTKGFKSGHSNYTSYKNCLKCYTQFFNQYWHRYFDNYAEAKNYEKLIINQQ